MSFSQNRLLESRAQNISKIAFSNSMKLSGFDPCIMNYVLSGVVLWPKVKFFINIPIKLEKILLFGMLFWTGNMQTVSSYGKNQFHLKHSFILLLFSYHKTPLSSITKLFKKWPANLHSELPFPYQPVAMAKEQKNFHSNFNILSCFIIWPENFSAMWTWLRERKSGGCPLNNLKASFVVKINIYNNWVLANILISQTLSVKNLLVKSDEIFQIFRHI